MTDKYIIKLITNLNRNPNFKDCIKVSIGKNVELAHIWDNGGSSNSHIPNTYFLIKENNKYVGAVLDMFNDLHWVILPKHRKNGHLSLALTQVILPHILEEMPRVEQKITIKHSELGKINYQNSLRVALRVGFKQIDEENLVFEYNSLNEEDYQLEYQYKGLTEEAFSKTVNELQLLAKKINITGSKIQLGYGKEIEEYTNLAINERVDNIANLKHIFKDIKNDFEN